MNPEAFKDAKAEIKTLADVHSGGMRLRFEGYVCGFLFCDACRHQQGNEHTIDMLAWGGVIFLFWRLFRRWQARRIIRDTIANAWLKTMEDL